MAGATLDLDFRTATGNPLCTRGWVMRQGDGWLLQLFDIGDLLLERTHAWQHQGEWQLAKDIDRALRECSAERLTQCVAVQLQHLAEHWHVPAVRLMLPQASGWRTFAGNETPCRGRATPACNPGWTVCRRNLRQPPCCLQNC